MSGHFCIKFTFVFINLIFLASGIALTVLAGIGQSELDYISDALGAGIFPTVNLVLGVGIIIIVISILGLFAGCTEKSCLLTTFGIVLIILLLIQFAAAVAAFILKQSVVTLLLSHLFGTCVPLIMMTVVMTRWNMNIIDGFESLMKDTLKKAYKNGTDSEEATHFFNKIQQNYQCCGISNATDYKNYNMTIPQTCCTKGTKTCTEQTAYKRGCKDEISAFVSRTLAYLGLTDIIFCIITILQIIFTFCLVRSMKNYIMV